MRNRNNSATILAGNQWTDIPEAGCDEAGRGCLAGPVFAAAVILPDHFHCPTLNDSKKLSEKRRYQLRPFIEQNAIAWAIGIASAKEIDEMNILNASILAMHRAIDSLSVKPKHLLIDGNRFKPFHQIPYHCFVQGDGRFLSIAAASVLAKTYRDDYMILLDKQFPEYHWINNKGYPTEEHREAILKHGISPHHRRSFRLLDQQTKLIF